MVSDTLRAVMQKEGVVAIVAQGKAFPHVVNTWHSYVRVSNDSFIVPVGGMQGMEEALSHDNRVLVTVGSKEVEGLHGMGTGFLLSGHAKMIFDGEEYALMKKSYPWARAIMNITILNATQTV
ncbi:MAG: putative FMN-binding protein [Proteobacteria bacterium]|nr:putative FMN-binding protein [Pseudomonadota bacterium]